MTDEEYLRKGAELCDCTHRGPDRTMNTIKAIVDSEVLK